LDIVKAVVLGIVQGLTEFLPISSSAHLEIVPRLLGWGDAGPAFTAVTQLGTIAAVIIYFRKDLARMVGAFLASLKPGGDRKSTDARMAWAVVYGTVPVIVLALVLKPFIENQFRNLYVVATMFIVMGTLLLISETVAKHKRTIESITPRDGWIVGLWQALALVPGASRSGSTLTGALLTGLDRETAARFSFLLSVPAVLISGLYEIKDIIKPKAEAASTVTLHMSAADTAIAAVVAGLVGYACIAWLLKFLRTNSTLPFILYRYVVGGLLFYLLLSHQLSSQ
jgi:undecaprenyl-diphosphatase